MFPLFTMLHVSSLHHVSSLQIYGDSKLLFCDHILNGYGYTQRDFKKQISKSRIDFLHGQSLPNDFRFRSAQRLFVPPVISPWDTVWTCSVNIEATIFFYKKQQQNTCDGHYCLRAWQKCRRVREDDSLQCQCIGLLMICAETLDVKWKSGRNMIMWFRFSTYFFLMLIKLVKFL